MGRMSPFLRSLATNSGDHGLAFWCPACKEVHIVYVKRSGPGPVWGWNDDVIKPTFSPSIKVTYIQSVCHFFVRDGEIEYCGDSTHRMAGHKIQMPKWPYAQGAYGGVEDEVRNGK